MNRNFAIIEIGSNNTKKHVSEKGKEIIKPEAEAAKLLLKMNDFLYC